MLSIAITGGIGSGKSTVADAFVARGAALVDTDVIAHELTAPGGAAIEPIRARFGADFIADDGRMDRARMRAHVFGDEAERRALEAILHPMIHARTASGLEAARASGHEYALVAIPLLLESGSPRSRADRILVVDCAVPVQIERVMRRSNLAREQVEAIIGAQASREARLAVADDVIDNSGAPEAIAPQVEALHARYLALAGAGRTGR